MARRTKSRRRHRRAPERGLESSGFDYGCLPNAAAIGAFDFPEHLSAASVEGVAYGGVWSEEVRQTVPTISLVARNGDALLKAFQAFNAWSALTDPDSVELTFVFRRDGGYVLAISPEYARLERRCLGFDRTHRAFAITATWFKPIDSVHPMLRRFRRHCSAPVAPFLFDGVTYAQPRYTLTASSPPDLHLVPGLTPLLKFDATFIDEADVIPHTLGWMALQTAADSLPPRAAASSGPPALAPEDLAQQRIATLGHHFPVTLERIRRIPALSVLIKDLASLGVRRWQVEQALCNLVLHDEIRRGVHVAQAESGKADRSLTRVLKSRYELADGTDLPVFNVDQVRDQVLADSSALLRFLGREPANDLAGSQAVLHSASTLDAPAATAVEPLEEIPR